MVEKFDNKLSNPTSKKTLADEYNNLKNDRQPYLDKAREASKYTIPSLLKETDAKVQTLTQPNQSVGADGVNNLSAKVTLAMLPPNQPCFKFGIDADEVKAEAGLVGREPTEFHNEVVRGLSLTEQMLVDYNERNGDRICAGEAWKHLYIAGNVFLLHTPDNGLKLYPLNRYVVKRDYSGNALKAITTETVGFYALPEDIQAEVLEALKKKENKEELGDLENKEITLYTVYKLKGKHWITYQEVEGIEIPKTQGKYPKEICPFMALRYTRIDGENYGRGLIEEYIGDITYLDCLSKAIREASLAASKFIVMVNPNGVTDIRKLAKTKNGGFCQGRADDVNTLQANKYYDLKTAQEEKQVLERRLYRVFLLAQAVQRDSERTTATEIQYMIRDLEEALGNHYSIMSKEFQLPYIKISFYHLRKLKNNKLPDLVRNEKIKLTITTGIEALGRGSDLTKLTMFGQTMLQFAQIAQATGMKIDVIASKVANSMNLDIEGLFPSQEEQAMAQAEVQQAQMVQQALPNLVNKSGDLMMQQNELEAQQN